MQASIDNAEASEKKKINADQVSWIMASLSRFQTVSKGYSAGYIPEAAQLATFLEIMKILGYEFADTAAAYNALSRFLEFHGILVI